MTLSCPRFFHQSPCSSGGKCDNVPATKLPHRQINLGVDSSTSWRYDHALPSADTNDVADGSTAETSSGSFAVATFTRTDLSGKG